MTRSAKSFSILTLSHVFRKATGQQICRTDDKTACLRYLSNILKPKFFLVLEIGGVRWWNDILSFRLFKKKKQTLYNKKKKEIVELTSVT